MKEVLLLGRGVSWKDCPFNTECWTAASTLCTPEIMGHIKDDYSKIHKVFASDDYSVVKNMVRTAKKHHIPVVSTQPYASEPFPLKEITDKYYNYFRPTVSYMIAYAIYTGYEKIRLYGIDQGPDWDYLINKPYVMYWLGVATGCGIKWEPAPSSILLETLGGEIKRYVNGIKEGIKRYHKLKGVK